jgi:hypothetical protein
MKLIIKGKALPLLLKFHIYLSTNSKPAQYPKLSQCMPNPEKQYSLVPKNLLSFKSSKASVAKNDSQIPQTHTKPNCLIHHTPKDPLGGFPWAVSITAPYP